MTPSLEPAGVSVGAGEMMASDLQQERRQVGDRRMRTVAHYDGAERRRSRGRRALEASARTENQLEPVDPENYLRVPVIVSRIGGEFDFVETDENAGRRHVKAMIDAITNRAGDSDNEDHAARLRHLSDAMAAAVHVRCGDNPTSESEFLSAMLVPGEPILFTYESLAQEIAARPLLERLAKVLDYRIVQWDASLRQAH